jgi:DNA-binding NarL/FixJ family response regulator
MIKHSQMAREIAARLTDREMDCLRLRAQGSGYAEIAETLGIRIGTVGALLARAQKKLLSAPSGEPAIPSGTGEAMRCLFETSEAYT